MTSPNITLRLTGRLREYLAECTGPNGVHETPSEYLRDLIRRDMERTESLKWERLCAALAEGLATPESEFKPLTADDVKSRARKRHGLPK